jgi:DNA-binding NarL/FixJ family response regulator
MRVPLFRRISSLPGQAILTIFLVLMLSPVGVTLLAPIFHIAGVAHNGRELISEAIRLDPDVIVADISMPEIDGIEAASQLRATGSRAKLVFLTIHTEEEFVNACVAEGALGYVRKTHLKRDLIQAIQAALSGHSFISPGG